MKKVPLRTREVKSYLIPYGGLPRPVYWFNDSFAAGTWSDRHRHDGWGELVYMASGKMVVCTALGNFLVPPQRMVWIPPGMSHEWYLPDATNDRSLFIDPSVLPCDSHFSRFCALAVTPLVRELILELEHLPRDYGEGPDARLVQTLLDQLAKLTEVSLTLQLPSDRRLLQLCASLLNTPDSTKTLSQWSHELGMSERNLGRLFQRQTGETPGRWRHRARLAHARERLEAGESVTLAALEAGYASVSAFIAAFRKLYGHTPGAVQDTPPIR
ncbi:MAG TPA: helix-turn-helix transcriptional regulator [Candidatus Avidesulfovibrio excrementigallinarum]|nr:helix-turn-helix transcriptional regulator [Candidatus Avidesulfovibrio excrementigallinarum]